MSSIPNGNANNHLVEPGRHVPALQHQPAHRGARRPSRVDLILRTPRFREDQFRDLFRDERRRRRTRRAADRAARRTRRAGARRRRRPPAPPNATRRSRSRSSSTTSAAASAFSRSAWTSSRRRSARRHVAPARRPAARASRTCTSTRSTSSRASRPSRGSSRRPPAPSRDAQFSPDGNEVFYLEQGRIIGDPGRDARRRAPVAVTAEMDVDFAQREARGLPPGLDLHARRLLRRQVPRRRLGRRSARATRRASRRRRPATRCGGCSTSWSAS